MQKKGAQAAYPLGLGRPSLFSDNRDWKLVSFWHSTHRRGNKIWFLSERRREPTQKRQWNSTLWVTGKAKQARNSPSTTCLARDTQKTKIFYYCSIQRGTKKNPSFWFFSTPIHGFLEQMATQGSRSLGYSNSPAFSKTAAFFLGRRQKRRKKWPLWLIYQNFKFWRESNREREWNSANDKTFDASDIHNNIT